MILFSEKREGLEIRLKILSQEKLPSISNLKRSLKPFSFAVALIRDKDCSTRSISAPNAK